MKIPNPTSLSRMIASCAGSLLLLGTQAHPAILANWRFEDGSYLTDSSGGGHTLTGTTTPPTQVNPLPGSGNGSDFSNPIPQTGDGNTGLANYGSSQNGHLYLSDDGWMDSIAANNTFTVEALVNRTTDKVAQYILSQYEYPGTGTRSFAFGVGGSNLRMLLSDDGDTFTTFNSTLSLDKNVDYYVAASVDATDPTGSITFYLQDLTNGGTLQSQQLSHSLSGIYNPSVNVRVGANSTVTESRWTGLLDEVRISDTVLNSSELLVAIPEPSTMILVLGAGFAILATRKFGRR
ncbi:PEP-CTERM sorting domain-containing protein [Kiritimatiellota bacterium B12222]|nr:PEP-CTERM sorting domain-containing protein [Kiritimatiellota bacterium B12222]